MLVEERFLSKVNIIPGGCWLWTAYSEKGYGQFYYKGKTQKSHRVSYELFVGEIPEGLEIDHLCKVTNCVNPEHLEPVTGKINRLRSNDMANQNRQKTHCKHGHEFTEENTLLCHRERCVNKVERICRQCSHDRYLARKSKQEI